MDVQEFYLIEYLVVLFCHGPWGGWNMSESNCAVFILD